MRLDVQSRAFLFGAAVVLVATLIWWASGGEPDAPTRGSAVGAVRPEPSSDPLLSGAETVQTRLAAEPRLAEAAVEGDRRAWRVLVRAVDGSTGEPIARAECLASPQGSPPAAVGRTDDAGVLTWHVERPGIQLISGRADGRVAAPVEVQLDEPLLGAVVEVILPFESARSLAGRVSWSDGVPVDERVVVYAWPAGHAPGAAAIAARQPVHAPAARAVTSADGSFTLDGLPEQGSVAVVPALDGAYFPAHRHPFVEVGTAPVQLTVERLFAVIVELVEHGGAPILAPEGSYAAAGARVEVLDRKLLNRNASLDGLAASLAGLDPSVLAVDGWRRRLLVVSGPQADAVVGPVNFRAALPGHAPADTDVLLTRLDQDIQVQQLSLDRNVPGWGELIIELTGDPSTWVRGGLDRPVALLRVYGTDGSFEVPIQEIPDHGRVSVADMPAGRHEVSWVWTTGFAPELGPADLVVAPGGQTTWELSDGGVGALELSASLGSGRLSGPASFQLREAGSTSRLKWLTFTGGPYLAPGLPPGRYEVRLERPAPSDGLSDWVAVEVEGGARSAVELAGR